MRFPPPENKKHPAHYRGMCDYVRDKSRQAKGVKPPNGDIEDSELEGILEVCFALRTTMETDEGSVWLYRLTGIEERVPHVGFIYFLVTPREGGPLRTPLNTKVSPYDAGSRSITIYAREVHDQKREVSVELVDTVRKWLYAHKDYEPVKSTSFIRFVLEHARDWLLTASGTAWLEAQNNYDTKLKVYTALARYGETAYRITETTSQSSSTFWAGPQLNAEQRSWVEYEPKTFKRCDSCEQKYPCIQESTQTGNLCCSCLAQSSRDALVVLDFCSHNECRSIACPNVMTVSQVRARQAQWKHTLDVGART